MGQLLSPPLSGEELGQVRDAIGSLLYGAMLEGGAVSDLGVAHPLLPLRRHGDGGCDPGPRLQEHLLQLKGDIGNRVPTYLKDLIGRLSSFSDEPRLAGLLGLVVSMVMDMVYASSRRSPGAKGRSPGSSSSQQRVWELQEVMEEYLKRCRINLDDKERLVRDAVRLEAQLSLTLTQLKTCLLGGDCDSRSLRQWASGAAFHTHMLAHLAGLEGQAEPLAAAAALEQYKEDLAQILPVYRRYKSDTLCVAKCRGGLPPSRDATGEALEDGAMTGLALTDRETGKGVTVSLAALEAEAGRGSVSGTGAVNPDLVTSDQYAQAYLDHLFSEKGPVAQLENYFARAGGDLSAFRAEPGRDEAAAAAPAASIFSSLRTEQAHGEPREGEEAGPPRTAGDGLKMSAVETQPS